MKATVGLLLFCLTLLLSSCKTSQHDVAVQQTEHTEALEALQRGSFYVEISSVYMIDSSHNQRWHDATKTYLKMDNGKMILHCPDFISRSSPYLASAFDRSTLEGEAKIEFKKRDRKGDCHFTLRYLKYEWGIILYKGTNECDFLNKDFGYHSGFEGGNFKGKVYPLNGSK